MVDHHKEMEAMLKDPSLLATLGEKKAAWDYLLTIYHLFYLRHLLRRGC